MAERSRLDELMVARRLAPSRARARDAILRGRVAVAGRTAEKAGELVARDAPISVADPALAWVSRAALKLTAALDAFGIDPAGRVAVDLGASTGGFTQVLLARGATRVHAVDVGHGQLAPVLAKNRRVVVHDGINARALDEDVIGEPFDLVVADVSFISLRLALPAALALAQPASDLAVLVKPQFELGPEALGRGGIVRDPAAGATAAQAIADWLADAGWTPHGIVESPIAGGSGNVEYLAGASRRG